MRFEINGTRVTPGAKLWDVLTESWVEVRSVDGGVAQAVNAAGTVLRITDGGRVGPFRRFYWHNPILHDPKAVEPLWPVARRMIEAMFDG